MRKVSGLERVWLAARHVAPPFANQLVLEGKGWPTPPGGWDVALANLAEAQPGCRLRLRGVLGNMRWTADGPLPREVDGSAWDGMDPRGATFLSEPIHPGKGPNLEILLVHGSPPRVVLRSLNAATDGAGMQLLARGVFASLRGEAPPRASAGPENDMSLARDLGVQPTAPPPQDACAPTGAADPSHQGWTWKRTRVPVFNNPLPNLALALATDTRAGKVFRVDIPVDLRRYATRIQSTANLTGWMQLPVHLHLGADDPVEALRYVLRDGIQRKAPASMVLGAGFARSTPLPLLGWAGRRMARQCQRDGRYATSAVLSHLGKLDLRELSGGGFRAERAFFVPPGSPGQPAFVTTTVGPEGVELCIAMPNALASEGRLDDLIGKLRRCLPR